MSRRRCAPLWMLALVAFSCTENKPPPSKPTQELQPQAASSLVRSDMPVPPKGAQWTIHCYSIGGPNHIEQARQLKADLLKSTPLREWYVVHGEEGSTLYHGFYRSINDPNDPKESKRAQADRRRIDSLTVSPGERPFARCIFVELDAPDPVAPPEWNLVNSGAYWSLQIAAYKDSPLRKQYAVDAVREARKQGVEAYYYHGETISSVCIGSWPREAVKELEQDPHTATAVNPSEPFMVTPFPLPGMSPETRSASGERMKTIAPRNEAVDPTLITAMNTYPNHSVNGEVIVKQVRDPLTGRMKESADPSFLVVIPPRPQSILSGGGSLPGTEAPLQRPAQAYPDPQPQQRPKPTPKAGVGTLKSIGD